MILKIGLHSEEIPKITKVINSYFNVDIPISKVYTYSLAYYVTLFQAKKGLQVDGLIGKNTLSAIYDEYPEVEKVIAVSGSILDSHGNLKSKYKIPHYSQSEMERCWGRPGESSKHRLYPLPYPMYLSWDTKVKVKRVTFHQKAGDSLISALEEIRVAYGKDKIHKLGLDLLGGTYNFRKKRGGNSYSAHAYACAIDIDPLRNPFRARPQRAAMSKPEYFNFVEIMRTHGFKTISYDLQHFQAKCGV